MAATSSTQESHKIHPIHEAAYLNDQATITKYLDEDRTLIDILDEKGCAPIFCAAGGGHHELVQWLLDMGTKHMDTPDCTGMTPMHMAASKGHCRVMRVLLLAGSKAISLQDRIGRTPMHVAVIMGYKHAFAVTLKMGPESVKMRTCAGYLPIHFAAEMGNPYALKRLIKKGPKSLLNDNQTSTGETPLHMAVRTHKNRCVIILLANGAHPSTNVRDRVGLRPITYALQSGDVLLIGLLVKHCENDVKTLIAGQNAFIVRHKVL